MDFSTKYEEIKNILKDELCLVEQEMFKGLETYLDLKDYITAPSKHIRPVVSFLYLKACGYEITEQQIKLQAAAELIHNASLIHDDVIDDSEIRRKKDSFNKKEGNHMAVIAGDFILSFALEKLLELKSTELIEIFTQTLNKMCKGEINQHSMKYKIPSLEEYIEKTYYKTGALFEASLKGALLLETQSNIHCEFAKDFGIAFQIRDDIKNIYKDSPDSDIKNGIYTAPVIYSGDIQNPYAGIEKAKSLLNNYVSEAKNNLKFLPENIYKNALIELVELLNND